MSMYADYLKERTTDEIIETHEGFVTFRYLQNDTVYIVDVYVKPEFRRSGVMSNFGDMVVDIAKKRGCKTLLGSVVPSMKGSTESARALFAYGMRLKSSGNDFIFFEKDI